MRLFDLPRRRYTEFVTPLHPLPRLSCSLGGASLWIKRDDQLGLAGGGNKTRKLEYVMAAALAQDAQAIMTVGAVQSNHCRLTLAAARREGLPCYLVLEERVAESYSPRANGNNLLYHLLGAEQIFVSSYGTDLERAIANAQHAVAVSTGRQAWFIPGGASTSLGAAAYAAAMLELLEQCRNVGISFDALVVASGSGGTHAGLLAGKALFGFAGDIRGISVRHPRAAQSARIASLARETLDFVGSASPIPEGSVRVDDEWIGPGYSIPDERTLEAMRMFAESEGILLDPVYTGKAAAGLIGLVRSGAFGRGANVLFWHTGGWPALFAYANRFLPAPDAETDAGGERA